MQTVETLNEGLKRAYTLTIAAKDIAARVEQEVARLAPQVRMPGFRPGKVPANLIKKITPPYPPLAKQARIQGVVINAGGINQMLAGQRADLERAAAGARTGRAICPHLRLSNDCRCLVSRGNRRLGPPHFWNGP